MKNIFNKTNAPYLASGALAIGTLLASGIFAVAPYIGFLAPVAALSLGLPFVIGGAIFSVAVIALSYKAIGKNGDIRKQNTLFHEEAKKNAELTLELKEKDAQLAKNNTKLFDKQEQLPKEGVNVNYLDLAGSSKGKQANGLDYLDLATSKDLNRLNVEIPSQENQPTKSEDEDIFYDAEPGEEKSTENPSSESHSTQNGQSWAEWCTDKAKTAARLAAGVAIFAATVAPNFMGTFLEGPEVSSVDGRLNSTNNTLFRC